VRKCAFAPNNRENYSESLEVGIQHRANVGDYFRRTNSGRNELLQVSLPKSWIRGVDSRVYIEKALPSLLSSVKALPNVIAVVRPAGMNLNAFSLLFKESSLIQQ
jgi:hypothetical protein